MLTQLFILPYDAQEIYLNDRRCGIHTKRKPIKHHEWKKGSTTINKRENTKTCLSFLKHYCILRLLSKEFASQFKKTSFLKH